MFVNVSVENLAHCVNVSAVYYINNTNTHSL